jgi:hypothetical protein
VSDALGSRSKEALLPTFILLQDIVETFAIVVFARPRLGASALSNELLSFPPSVIWLGSSSISTSRHEAGRHDEAEFTYLAMKTIRFGFELVCYLPDDIGN